MMMRRKERVGLTSLWLISIHDDVAMMRGWGVQGGKARMSGTLHVAWVDL